MTFRGSRVMAAIVVLALGALVIAPASVASEPSGADSNGRAIITACPDGYGGTVVADPGWETDGCLSLAEALSAAVDNGTPDDLILLRPGYYCPVDIPDTGNRLWLQGIPRSAFDSPPGVEAPTASDVEAVTFAPYATDHCGTAYSGSVIYAGTFANLIFLSNLAVDGANDPLVDEGHASYGILINQPSSYLRDVVVKHAQTGLKILGGQVSHSAFVQNLSAGIETQIGASTWIQDTLLADNVDPGSGQGMGLLEPATSSLSASASTLVNVTITGNEIGLGRNPSTTSTYTKVRNSFIAGNGADCGYMYAGMNSLSSHNVVTEGCYGLATTADSLLIDAPTLGAVQYLAGFEPYLGVGAYPGDPNSCSLTDQLERLRTTCYVGAISPIVASPPPDTPPAISTFISFPESLEMGPVEPGETAYGTAWFSNARDGYVTVRDVQVSAGFAVEHDDCSLGFMPRIGTDPGGQAPQPYCYITVTAQPTGHTSGTLTVTTNLGVVSIPLAADVVLPLVSATPTLSGPANVGANVAAVPGAWTAGADFTYQWLRDGGDISGATNATYKPTASDRGKQLSVAVTGTLAGYTTVTKTSAAVTVGYGTLTAPTPTITGTAKVGSTLTAKAGTWSAGTALTYQWRRGGVAIAGATKSTYKQVPADRGKKVSVAVTGTLAGYTTVTKVSATKTVGYGTLTTVKPKITGTAKVGKTLTAKPGTWKAGSKAAALKYQWYADGKAISGATKSTYKVKTAQKGKKITVKVKGSSTGYTTVTKASAATSKVKS